MRGAVGMPMAPRFVGICQAALLALCLAWLPEVRRQMSAYADTRFRPMPSTLLWSRRLALVAEVLFGAFLVLVLGTHADTLHTGPFTWLPIYRITLPSDTVVLGILTLLPVAWVLAWVGSRYHNFRWWLWGHRSLTVPLAVLSLWAVLDLSPGMGASGLKALLSLWLIWLVYWYVINERPRIVLPFVIVIVLQSLIGIGQVWRQSDLGLWWLGEYQLDPQAPGVLVVVANGERWLRAYGLAGGPTALGATLGLLLLMIAPSALRAKGRMQWVYSAVLTLGVLGLLATFSRSAMVALGFGLVVWASLALLRGRRLRWTRQQFVAMGLPLVLGLVFLFANSSALATRLIYLTSPLEAQSLSQREHNLDVVVQIVEAAPLRGVGFGNIHGAVKTLDPGADVVHSAPLLVAAELGLVGVALWTWLVLAGMWRSFRLSAWHLGLWVTAIVPSLFGPWWLTISWRATILLGIVAGMTACVPPLRFTDVGEDEA